MALAEELEPARPDGQLVRLGPEQVAGDADVIPEVEQREDLEFAFRQRVTTDVDLQPRSAVREHEEAGLPEAPDGQEAAGRRGLDAGRLEIRGGRVPVCGDERRHGVGRLEAMRISAHAETRERLEVGLALRDLLVFLSHSPGERPRSGGRELCAQCGVRGVQCVVRGARCA
jgi:hypothetical protein